MTTMDMSAPYGSADPLNHDAVRQSAFSMRGRIITGSLMAVLLIVGIGGWAATAKLSGAVISSGTVLVNDNLKVVQHLDGGVVREIDVRKGDVVAQGQVLLRLDTVQIRTEQSILNGQLAELLGRQARLTAERDAATSITFPTDYRTNFVDAVSIMRGEQQLFDSNLRNRLSQRDQLRTQISQLKEEIGGLEMQQSALVEELTLAKQERERMSSLSAKALIETTRINAADRELARMSGSQGELTANIARTKAKISEIELQILSIDDLAYTDAQKELRTVEGNIAELDDRLAEVHDRLGRTEIRSPVAGTINDLSVTTEGGVITPAEALMTIVPKDADLKIEFKIATKDIDQIDIGQTAKLRFSSFDQRTTPEIDGVISRISAAATTDPNTGQSYYVGQADVTGDLSVLGSRGLIPGMPVDIFVQTQEQVAIAYFAKPFTDQIARAFREE